MNRPPRVLFVDDEPDLREVVELSLATVGGFDVQVAASGAQALKMAAEQRPDVILLDVMMPGMDGPSTLARLQAEPELASVPVIFLTAKLQGGEQERLVGLGARGVIAKPFDPLLLPEQVRELIQFAA